MDNVQFGPNALASAVRVSFLVLPMFFDIAETLLLQSPNPSMHSWPIVDSQSSVDLGKIIRCRWLRWMSAYARLAISHMLDNTAVSVFCFFCQGSHSTLSRRFPNDGSKRLEFRWQYLTKVSIFRGTQEGSAVVPKLRMTSLTAASSMDIPWELICPLTFISVPPSSALINWIAFTHASWAVLRWDVCSLSLLDRGPSFSGGGGLAWPGTDRKSQGLSMTTISSSEYITRMVKWGGMTKRLQSLWSSAIVVTGADQTNGEGCAAHNM